MDIAKLNEIRERILKGEEVPREVLRECIEYLRQGRHTARKEEKPQALEELRKLLEG